MPGRAFIQRLKNCRRGNALIMLAATLPLLVAASAIGLDTIQVTLAKRQLQRAADSAAMAGAYGVLTNQGATPAVDRDLAINNTMTLSSPRVIENAPSSGTYSSDNRAVRVVLQAQRSVPFISFFTGSTMPIQVEATATAVPSGIYCVVSLESSSATGITFAGSSDTNLGCGVATNSTGANAIQVNGNPDITASPVAARGGVPAASNFSGNTTLIPYSPPQPDPFASLANPTLPATCNDAVSVSPNATVTLSPGCYEGMDLKGTVTLQPGTYYIDGGELSFGAQAEVTGNGVTFVLTSRNATSNPASIASLSMNGGAQIRLTAPTTGEYAGLILYQDRRATNQSPKINGGSGSIIDGAIYMPTQDVTFNGNAGMTVNCLRLVSLRVTFSGNSSVTNTCPSTAPKRGFEGIMVRLVS